MERDSRTPNAHLEGDRRPRAPLRIARKRNHFIIAQLFEKIVPSCVARHYLRSIYSILYTQTKHIHTTTSPTVRNISLANQKITIHYEFHG